MATVATYTIAGQHTIDLQLINGKYFLNYGCEEETFICTGDALNAFKIAARHAEECAGWHDE